MINQGWTKIGPPPTLFGPFGCFNNQRSIECKQKSLANQIRLQPVTMLWTSHNTCNVVCHMFSAFDQVIYPCFVPDANGTWYGCYRNVLLCWQLRQWWCLSLWRSGSWSLACRIRKTIFLVITTFPLSALWWWTIGQHDTANHCSEDTIHNCLLLQDVKYPVVLCIGFQ